MSFKRSQIPDDAVNTKEIDSVYSFLAHVSIESLYHPSPLNFFYQIDWYEPGIQALVAFHIITLLLIIVTRNRVTFQGTLFTLFCKSFSDI